MKFKLKLKLLQHVWVSGFHVKYVLHFKVANILMSQVNSSCWNLDYMLFSWLEFFSWGVYVFHFQSSSFLKIFVAKFVQASSHFWPTTERWHSERVRAAIRKLNVVEDNTMQMVCILHSTFLFLSQVLSCL